MTIKLLIAAFAAQGALSTAALAETVNDAALGFSAEFPAEPDLYIPSAEQLAEVGAVRAVTYELSHNGAYSVSAAQLLPAGQVFADPKKALALIREDCMMSGNIVREAAFALPGGHGGEAMTVRKDSMGINEIWDLVRFAVRGNKIYCARATARGGPNGTEAQRRFIRTFSISTK